MTPEAILRIPHSLGQAQARRRVEKGVAALQGEYANLLSGVDTRWEGSRLSFGLTALAQRVEGSVDVEDSFVEVRARLPLMLRLLAHAFMPKVEKTGRSLLE